MQPPSSGGPCRGGPHGQAVNPAGSGLSDRPTGAPPTWKGVEASPHATLWVQTLGYRLRPRARQRLLPASSLWRGPAARPRGARPARTPQTVLPPRPSKATVAKGRGSTARSLRVPVARNIAGSAEARSVGFGFAPQPRDRKNYRVSERSAEERAPGALAGIGGRPPGESRAHLWVQSQGHGFPPCQGENWSEDGAAATGGWVL